MTGADTLEQLEMVDLSNNIGRRSSLKRMDKVDDENEEIEVSQIKLEENDDSVFEQANARSSASEEEKTIEKTKYKRKR
jgi:poly(A) polymerase Pap1